MPDIGGPTIDVRICSPDSKYNDTDGVAAFVALTYAITLWLFHVRLTPDSRPPSGDEAIKFISVLTDWAIPAATNTFDTNFALPTTNGTANGIANGTVNGAANGTANGDVHKALEVAHSWAPFNLAFDTKLGFFPWLELPQNKARRTRFGHAMTGTRQWETKDGILHGERALVPPLTFCGARGANRERARQGSRGTRSPRARCSSTSAAGSARRRSSSRSATRTSASSSRTARRLSPPHSPYVSPPSLLSSLPFHWALIRGAR